jgi:hypothetical protein
MIKLPEIIKLEDCQGDPKKHIEAVYVLFKKDFIDSKPQYKNVKVSIIKKPIFDGKEWSFWHLTSQGKEEDKRIPDLRKCERIGWIKPVIESSENGEIKFWKNKRKSDNRICLCYGDWEYLVVLIDKNSYVILFTAYPIQWRHTREKLEKEYNDYILHP